MGNLLIKQLKLELRPATILVIDLSNTRTMSSMRATSTAIKPTTSNTACTMISLHHEILHVKKLKKSKRLRRESTSMSTKKRKAPDPSKLSKYKETNFDKTFHNCSNERVIAYCLINFTHGINQSLLE